MLPEGMRSRRGTYLHVAPMFHLADVAATYAHLLAGSAHAVVRMFAPEATAPAMEKFRITRSLLVPTITQILADHPSLAKYDVSSLHNVLYGASPISEAVLDRAMAKLPH